MARLSIGQQVMFEFNGIKRIGKIEEIVLENRQTRYDIRCEGGKLFPAIGINTQWPGKILLELSRKYFKNDELGKPSKKRVKKQPTDDYEPLD